MWNLRDKYVIAGIGHTAFSKNSGVTVLELAAEARRKACADVGVRLDEIDGIIKACRAPEAVTADTAVEVVLHYASDTIALARVRPVAPHDPGRT